MRKKLKIAILLLIAVGLGCGVEIKSEEPKPTEPPSTPTQPLHEIQHKEWSRSLFSKKIPEYIDISSKCENTSEIPKPVTFIETGEIDGGFEVHFQPIYRGYASIGGYETISLGFSEQEGFKQEEKEERAVEEPDIFAIQGNYLFLLNKFRGIQSVYINDQNSSQILSSLFIPGIPTEIYVKGKLAILGVMGFYPTYSIKTTNEAIKDSIEELTKSKFLFLDISNPENPEMLTGFYLEGYLVESRLVGDVLYVVSATSHGVSVSSFLISDPKNILKVDEIKLTHSVEQNALGFIPEQIHVAPSSLFIASPRYSKGSYYNLYKTIITHLDISDPSGKIYLRGEVEIPGIVLDRFKMDFWNGMLRVVSTDVSSRRTPQNRLFVFEVYPELREIGRLENIGTSEQLFATRFDGDKAYIVTYRIIDPLWIVDLSNPSNPKIRGELHVPGWSEYIEPLGSRLLGLGIDDTAGLKLALSLFDVSDPENPKLLSKIKIGEGSSSSYALRDFKAFKVLKDKNLILLPFKTYDYRGGLDDGVQLINFSQDSLSLKGFFKHLGTVLRVFPLSDEKVLALSERALQVTDISDRDNPNTLFMLNLLRPVFNVFEAFPAGQNVALDTGDGFIEIASLEEGLPSILRIRVSSKGEKIKTFFKGNHLFILRYSPIYYYPEDLEIFLVRFENKPEISCVSVKLPKNEANSWTFLEPSLSVILENLLVVPVFNFIWRYSHYSQMEISFLVFDLNLKPVSYVKLPYKFRFDNILYFRFGIAESFEIAEGFGSYAQNNLVRGSSIYLPYMEESQKNLTEAKPFALKLNFSNPESPTVFKINIPGRLISVSWDGKIFYSLYGNLFQVSALSDETIEKISEVKLEFDRSSRFRFIFREPFVIFDETNSWGREGITEKEAILLSVENPKDIKVSKIKILGDILGFEKGVIFSSLRYAMKDSKFLKDCAWRWGRARGCFYEDFHTSSLVFVWSLTGELEDALIVENMKCSWWESGCDSGSPKVLKDNILIPAGRYGIWITKNKE